MAKSKTKSKRKRSAVEALKKIQPLPRPIKLDKGTLEIHMGNLQASIAGAFIRKTSTETLLRVIYNRLTRAMASAPDTDCVIAVSKQRDALQQIVRTLPARVLMATE